MTEAAAQPAPTVHEAGRREQGQRPFARAFRAVLEMSQNSMERVLRIGTAIGAAAGGIGGFKLYASTTVGLKTLCFATGASLVAGAGLGLGLTGIGVGLVMMHQERKARKAGVPGASAA